MVDINDEPAGLDAFVEQVQRAPAANESQIEGSEPEGLDQFIAPELRAEKYGTIGQQAITGLEGAAKAATFGTSAGIETALGVNPEDIRGRQEENPLTHMAGEGVGLVGTSFIPGVGAANLLGTAGRAGAAAVGLGAKAGAGFVRQVGAEAVKGAFEAALYQGGVEVSKAFAEDPNQTAESAIADIGLASVLGGVFSGTISAALKKVGGAKGATEMAQASSPPAGRFVSELDRPSLDAGDFKAAIEHSDLIKEPEKKGILSGLAETKKDAKEIQAAAKRLGTEALEGMTSASPWVQKAEDSLINGAPTLAGMARKAKYDEVYAKAAQAAEEAVGHEEARYTKAELGNMFKDSISAQLKEQIAPTEALYTELKKAHEVIPLHKKAGAELAESMKELQELKLSPSSPEGQIAKRVMREVSALKTVDDVKAYNSILNRSVSPTASSGEKRMVSVISDKLKALEESAVERFALSNADKDTQGTILALIEKRKLANKQYSKFMDKVQTLSEQLGKGRVYGLNDALTFIRDRLTPEEITTRLFDKKNSEFLKHFGKEFPQEMALMQEYQKGVLKEAASKTGTFSPKLLFNQVNRLEPEIQKALFKPEELTKLKDAETVLRAFPKNFNPSGTSGMAATRQFFEHPLGAAMSNARDAGVLAFIKGAHALDNPEIMQATALGRATVRGWKAADKAVKNIVRNEAMTDLPAVIGSSAIARERIDKRIDEYQKNPEKLMNIGNNNPVTEYAAAFGETSARAVSYLASLRPPSAPQNPLDPKPIANNVQKAAYDRALDIAQQPLIVLKSIKQGSLTPQDVLTLKTLYPSLYKSLNLRIMSGISDAISKGHSVPYKARLGMSMFLGQPLDSTMTPQAIMSAQAVNQAPSQSPQGPDSQAPGPKKSMAPLGKTSNIYQTPGQARQKSLSTGDHR